MGVRQRIVIITKEQLEEHSDKTGAQLAAIFNCSTTIANNRRKELGLKQIKLIPNKYPDGTIPYSKCFSCANGYADRCLWVREMKKVWTKAVKRADESNPGAIMYRVTKCKHFKVEVAN